MKQRIVEQVQLKGLEDNIKLGAGGIREIEFIGQAFQLIYGGKREALRQRSILAVLEVLRDGLMPADAVDELKEAYRYLRRLENRLQQIADQQTHELPHNDIDQARIQFAAGSSDWQSCRGDVAAIRKCVQQHFNALLGPAEPQRNGVASDVLNHVWADEAPEQLVVKELEDYGFQRAKDIYDMLLKLKQSRRVRGLGSESRERLEAFMPQLLAALTDHRDAAILLQRLLPLLETLAQRSVYLALLMEQPQALKSLLKLTAANKWLSEQITRQPLLLDELLDVRALAKPAGPESLVAELEGRLSNVSSDDIEARMDALRQFKHAQVLRISAADVLGTLPLAEVSNHLSFVAETVVDGARQLAWTDLSARHGHPRFDDHTGKRREAGFAVVAYGKLGGLELGYGSDLDLIFLHDSHGGAAHTDGERSLDNQTFFTRLAQRLIHYLSTQTAAGRCYEIDTRLRPSGNAGLLVTSLNAFEHYQLNEAWTWEHQALIRARAVAGDQSVCKRFTAMRRKVLCLPRDPTRLREDILSMRERMRKQLDRSDAEHFDLKQGLGGMTDIEFLVQYVTLRWAHQWAELVDVTDNLRLLDALNEFQIIGSDTCAVMYNAYFAFRAEVHKAALQDDAALVESHALREHRDGIRRLWAQLERGEL
jgi:glutamate-ammonia-ligase adenylyltransferase